MRICTVTSRSVQWGMYSAAVRPTEVQERKSAALRASLMPKLTAGPAFPAALASEDRPRRTDWAAHAKMAQLECEDGTKTPLVHRARTWMHVQLGSGGAQYVA